MKSLATPLLVLIVSTLSFTSSLAAAESAIPTAFNISITGIGPAVDVRAHMKVMQLLADGVKQGILDRFITHGRPIEGGFSGCVSVNAKALPRRVLLFEKKLQAIRANPKTTAYSVDRTDVCEPMTTDIQALAFQSLENTDYSGVSTSKQVVVKDNTAWQELWLEHKSLFSPVPDLPSVDFSNKMLAGVFIGSRSNSCYGVKIESVDQFANQKITIKYRESIPTSEAVCAAVITNPVTIILLDRSDLPVEFLELPKNGSIQ